MFPQPLTTNNPNDHQVISALAIVQMLVVKLGDWLQNKTKGSSPTTLKAQHQTARIKRKLNLANIPALVFSTGCSSLTLPNDTATVCTSPPRSLLSRT